MEQNRNIRMKLLLLVLLLLFLVLGTLVLLGLWEDSTSVLNSSAEENTEQEGGEENRELTYFRGSWYARKENLETVLVMGLDKYEDTAVGSYNNNRQADFLMVIVLDGGEESYSVRHLNRDTMTEITVLGVTGAVAGRITGQLALAHTYGSGGTDSCKNTVKAVENLLYGIEIDHYLSLTMDAVALLNDMARGVTLEVLDDFTGIDDTLVQGETVTLYGSHALTYVRTRFGLEDSTNLHRMERQQQYLTALTRQLKSSMSEDGDFSLKALLEINEYLVSDCTIGELSELANCLMEYSEGEYLTLEGEAVLGEEYMEYYIDEDALQEMLIHLFYEEV